MWILSLVSGVCVLAGLPGGTAYLEGYNAYRAENYGTALQAFEQAAQTDSALAPWADLRAGMSLAAQQKHAEAEAAFTQLLEGPAGPWQAMARARLADLAARRSNDDGVVAHLAHFDGMSPVPWWMDKYRWRYSEIAIRQPDHRESGYAYFRDKAENTWYIKPRLDASRLLIQSPSPADKSVALLGMLRSTAYTEIKQKLPAVPVSLSGPDGEAVLIAGLANQLTDSSSENDGQAIAVLRQHGDNPAARFVLAYATRMVAAQKKFDQAENLCTALINLDPESREAGDTIWWLGNALERAGRIDDAERIYKMLPARCQTHHRADDALNRLGELYLGQGEVKKGMEYLVRLGREYPESRFRPAAYYTCAMHPSVQDEPDLKRLYLQAAADNAIGDYWAHRALARLREMESPAPALAVNLRVDGTNPVLLPAGGYLEPLPPLPSRITESEEYRRLAFFARHGMEESEWEVLPLLQGLDGVEDKAPYYRAFATAGVAHTTLEFARHAGWGVDADGTRSLDRLRLEYPLPYWSEVRELAEPLGLDPYLVLAVAKQESTFRPNLTSHAGASGVMQLMPPTAKWLADVDPNIERHHVANLESPVNSLRLGTYYLLRMLERSNGNLVDTLASYNGGPGNRDKWRRRFPNHNLDDFIEAIPFHETKDYVKKVLGNYAAYRSLYAPVE